MKFWELHSVVEGENHALISAANSRKEWSHFLDWIQEYNELVARQDRAKLDLELDDDFVRAVLATVSVQFCVREGSDGSGALWLARYRRETCGKAFKVLSAVEAFNLYGGTALEDALEYGSYKV